MNTIGRMGYVSVASIGPIYRQFLLKGGDLCIQICLTIILLSYSTYGFDLSNREKASLVWLIIFILVLFIYSLVDGYLRSSLFRALKVAVCTKLVFVWIGYIIWILLFVYITDRVGIWRPVLTKDTLVWSASAGVALLVGFSKASELGYFRQEFFKIISLAVVLEYILNLDSFSLFIELLLQPIILALIIVPVVIQDQNLKKNLNRAKEWVLFIIAIAILGYTIQNLLAKWQTIDLELLLFQGVWPMLLGIWVLMFVFPLSLIGSYEEAFIPLSTYRDQPDGLWKAKLGLVLALRCRLKWIREAAKGGTKHVATADSVSEAYEEAKHYKRGKIEEEEQEEEYQKMLEQYAGSTERDSEGVPKDKREFRESVDALEWLHTCQMGWYDREPKGYKSNLLDLLENDFTSHGLDKPSGINLEVSDDREKWYAWRQTPGGHYFAIGASEEPPSKWTYDGPEPPRDFPGSGSKWGDSPFSLEESPNWDV